jgi:nitrogen regulatory protein P-II 1
MFKKVHAVIRSDALDRVQDRLQALRLPNLVITEVNEFGEHPEFYAFRSSFRYARIEVFADAALAEEVAATIVETAHTGAHGDGLVAILPVEAVYRVRDKSRVGPGRAPDVQSGGAE